jgi:glycosyltransferase involved in cell wall biosynthesis
MIRAENIADVQPMDLHKTAARMPLVSVVMPSFNQAQFIEASIDSVLGQDYPRIELIVADGGSTDGTQAILARLQSRDSRLRWFSEPDKGPADALNKALKRVRGTLIGWLNSDDLYAPGAVSRAVGVLDSPTRCMMAYGHGQHIGEDGTVLGTYPTQRPEGTVDRFRQGCFICQPTVFFKRTLWQLLGPLDATLKTAFDFEYWVRAFLAFPGRIGFVDALQASSRLHDDCITLNMRRAVAMEGVQVLARHLGNPPMHWVMTYAEELLRMPPTKRPTNNLRAHLEQTVVELAQCFEAKELRHLHEELRADRRL